MTKAELNELKRSTKADLIQLSQDQTDNLQAYYEEIEELKSAIDLKNYQIEYYKENNKKLKEENSKDRAKHTRKMTKPQIINFQKDHPQHPVITEYFGRLSILN